MIAARLSLRPALGGGCLAALLLTACGCPPAARERAPAPRSAEEAIERVNANVARLRETLQAPALVSFSYTDDAGVVRRFIGHDAMLVYRPPRCLIFQVRSLAGTVAEFGSNDERYWVWIESDVRTLWHGRWSRAGEPAARRLPVPPSDLLDALMLRPLPRRLGDGPAAMLRVDGDDHRLLLVRLVDADAARGWREIRLAPAPPFLPLEVVDRLADGRVLMHAEIGAYRPVGLNGPLTPRRYVVRWPLDGAELRLDVADGARFRPGLEAFCEFPASWTGKIEPIDESPDQVPTPQFDQERPG